MDLNKLSLGDKIAGGCGIALILGLFLLPWHKIEFDFGFGSGVSESCSAFQCTNTFWAWLAFLVTLAVVAMIVLSKLTDVELPELPIPQNQALFYGTIAAGALLALKLITETDFLGWGAYVNLILAAGMIYGGFLIFKEEEGAGAASGGPPQEF